MTIDLGLFQFSFSLGSSRLEVIEAQLALIIHNQEDQRVAGATFAAQVLAGLQAEGATDAAVLAAVQQLITLQQAQSAQLAQLQSGSVSAADQASILADVTTNQTSQTTVLTALQTALTTAGAGAGTAPPGTSTAAQMGGKTS